MMEKDFIESIAKLIDRDLKKLADEINQYPTEESIWSTKSGIKNPAGNLCLHLCGNLQHYFGAVLGKTGYVRNRDNEFAAKNIPKAELLKEIEQARTAVNETLENLKPSLLLKEYPEKVFEYPMTSMHFFTHLTAHLSYHLGQVNYHRRLLS
jgi:uncharacterized damage-inducible protein DinB